MHRVYIPRVEQTQSPAKPIAVGVATVVIAVLFAFHFAYASILPLAWNIDSVGYYYSAISFLKNWSPEVFGIRTPGYPIFLAGMSRLFGDDVAAIAMAQHMSLAALGTLAIVALRRIYGLLGASLIGLLVGLSPVVSVMANSVMTETTFAVAIGTAAILYVSYGRNLGGLFVVGMCTAVAFLIRPTGVLLLAAVLAWMLIVAWCAEDGPQQRRAIGEALTLVAGYAILAGPWHFYIVLTCESGRMDHGRCARIDRA
jgi:4-amino-4-deoxy-L-arabinose transferase-like glycosyltransferase